MQKQADYAEKQLYQRIMNVIGIMKVDRKGRYIVEPEQREGNR